MFTSPALPFLHPATLIATWFGSGLLPRAPGTWGSLAALPVGLLLVWQAGPQGLFAGTLLVFLLGLWATGRYCARSGRADPGDQAVKYRDIVEDKMTPDQVAEAQRRASEWKPE